MRQAVAAVIAVLCCGVVPAHATEELITLHPSPVPVVAVHSLYASIAALSVVDWETTRVALGNGYHEANPMMSHVATNSAALLAVKVGAAAATIYLTQRLRPRHPAMAVTALIAANVVSGFVVTRNLMTISGRPTGIPAQ